MHSPVVGAFGVEVAEAAVKATETTADPELPFIKEKYRAPFRQALEEALSALPDRERLIMRLNLVTGMSVEGIGKMYGVSQSTASRWLARARECVIETAQRRLRARLGVSPDEMQPLAALVVSQLDLSVSRVLGQQP